MSQTEPKLLTTPEACAFLRIGRTTLYAISNLGRIPKTKIKGQVRWQRAALERYVQQQTRVGRRRA